MREGIIIALQFVAYAVVQVVLFRALGLYEVAFLHLHVLFLLMLPNRLNVITGLLLAFAFGLSVSLIDRPLAVHAIACLNLMVLRGWWLGVVTPGLAVAREPLDFSRQDLGWYLAYVLPLVAVYELTYLPVANLTFSWRIMLQIVASTVYTGVIALTVVLLFYKRR